jgi:hypothetical protein
MVDGNTRYKAATDREVQKDTLAAYVLEDITDGACREVGVYLNQRNGKDLDKSEALNWINEALAASMPLRRIARISGFSFNTVKKLDGVREFGTRAEKVKLAPMARSINEGAKALLAEKVQHDAVFQATASLAAESAMPLAELKPIVTLIAKTGTDEEALEIVQKERASRVAQIREYARLQTNGMAVKEVRPPYHIQMRKHLQFLVARDPLDLFDPSLATRADAEDLLRLTISRLNEALEIYAERKSQQAAG